MEHLKSNTSIALKDSVHWTKKNERKEVVNSDGNPRNKYARMAYKR